MAGHLQVILQSGRLPFLLLTLVAITLAASSVSYNFSLSGQPEDKVDFTMLPFIYAGAIFAHLSVNLFNEYWDFKSGLDLTTKRTPFSGGSGALPAQPTALNSVLYAAILFFVLTALIGVVLIQHLFVLTGEFNIDLLLLGLAGLVLVLIYTGPIQRYPMLCWAAPGLGFGIMMFLGTEIVLTSALSLSGIPAALIVFILSSNLLLLNQLPDIQADAQIGRRHLWISKGEVFSLRVYFLGTSLIPVLLMSGIYFADWPASTLWALLPWSLTLFSLRGAWQHRQAIVDHHAYLGMNVAASLLVPVFLSIALLLA